MTQSLSRIRTMATDSRISWFKAYKQFLVSRDEPLALKLAPLALIGILPEELLLNIVPGIGLLGDFGYFIALLIIAYKTFEHVNHYRLRTN